MDFKKNMKILSSKVESLLPQLETEEATKTAIILPFLQIIGYDIFDPTIIVPEYTADIGIKKGEKVDYAILENGEVAMLVECKHHKQTLTHHNSQLFRYFAATKTRFALLTNGIIFQFYSDLKAPNIMDESAFFTFDITKISEYDLDILEWFHTEYFDIPRVVGVAKQLKYGHDLKKAIHSEFKNPTPEFVKFWINKVYEGKLTAKAVNDFSPIVLEAIKEFRQTLD